MEIIHLQPAYILHRRAYRETSFLLEIFSCDYGRLSAIARGVRKPKSDWQGLLQPFLPLALSWRGRGELMLITHVEPLGKMQVLTGKNLYTGFYLNELLLALLQKWDAHPPLFTTYQQTVKGLQENCSPAPLLRHFELQLLKEIGYGLLPANAKQMDNHIDKDKYYLFTPEKGFVATANLLNKEVFSGKNLLAIANEDWHDEAILQDAKRLVRYVLTPLLGQREIYSRQLFKQLK